MAPHSSTLAWKIPWPLHNKCGPTLTGLCGGVHLNKKSCPHVGEGPRIKISLQAHSLLPLQDQQYGRVPTQVTLGWKPKQLARISFFSLAQPQPC